MLPCGSFGQEMFCMNLNDRRAAQGRTHHEVALGCTAHEGYRRIATLIVCLSLLESAIIMTRPHIDCT